MNNTNLKESAYDWVTVPNNYPISNLVLVKAKTTQPTYHKINGKKTKINYTADELRMAGRSLAGKPVGINHKFKIQGDYKVVDSQWNESIQAVEALVYLPDRYMNYIKEKKAQGKSPQWSIEGQYRKVIKESDDEITPKGIVFVGLDLLLPELMTVPHGAGDSNTASHLLDEVSLLQNTDETVMQIVESKGLFEMSDIETTVEQSTEQPVENKEPEVTTSQTENKEEKPNETETQSETKTEDKPVETDNKDSQSSTEEINKDSTVDNKPLENKPVQYVDVSEKLSALETKVKEVTEKGTSLESIVKERDEQISGLNEVIKNLQEKNTVLQDKENETIKTKVSEERTKVISKIKEVIPVQHPMNGGAFYNSLIINLNKAIEEVET